MNYALIENGVVTNLIWLYPGNASDFPTAVPFNGYPVSIGDTYEDGKFYRNGELLLTEAEYYLNEISTLNATISELDNALVEATYLSLEQQN